MTVRLLSIVLMLAGCGSDDSMDADSHADLASAVDASAAAVDGALPADLATAAFDGATPTSFGPYDQDGTDVVTVYQDSVSGDGHDFSVYVYAPGSAGIHPVVVLASGLQQPASAYAGYGRRLASHGIVAILRDDPGAFTSTTTVVGDLEYLVTTWLAAQSSSGKLMGAVDLTKVGLAGHSRGGQATLLAAEATLKGSVKAWVGIDPVDSAPTAGAPQARGAIGTIAIPLLFIGGGTSTACSPAADNYAVLYADSTTPAIELTVLDASHTEFEDPATCSFCGLCTPTGTASAPQVLAESIRYLAAYFAQQLGGDATVGTDLDGAGASLDIAAGRVIRSAK